jgi:hypothetical protein
VDPRRHGKLLLSSQTSEAKEKEEYGLVDNEFDAYYASNSNWCSDTDLSTMVSALSQVIGTSTTNNHNPHMAQSTSTTMVNEESQTPQPLLDQGLFLKLVVCLFLFFCLFCLNLNLAYV